MKKFATMLIAGMMVIFGMCNAMITTAYAATTTTVTTAATAVTADTAATAATTDTTDTTDCYIGSYERELNNTAKWAVLVDGSSSMKGLDAQIETQLDIWFPDVQIKMARRFTSNLYEEMNKIGKGYTDIAGAVRNCIEMGYEHIIVVTDGVQNPADYSSLPDVGYGGVDLHIVLIDHDAAQAEELINEFKERLRASNITSYNLFREGEVLVHAQEYEEKQYQSVYEMYCEIAKDNIPCITVIIVAFFGFCLGIYAIYVKMKIMEIKAKTAQEAIKKACPCTVGVEARMDV